MIVEHEGKDGTLAVHAVCDGCAVLLRESDAPESGSGVPVHRLQMSANCETAVLCAKCSEAFMGTMEAVLEKAIKPLLDAATGL